MKKHCLKCNKEFLKRYKESIKQWGAKRYCSLACARLSYPKGRTPWNKGKKLPQFSGKNNPFYGRTHSIETRSQIGESRKGKLLGNTFGFIKGQVPWNKGIEGYMGANKTSFGKGKKHFGWKGGISLGENRKEYRRFKGLERSARERKAKGSHTQEQWEELKRFYNYICLCCKQQEPFIKLTEDHIIPLSRNGSNDISNIQPLCGSCNSIKWAKIIDYRSFNRESNLI